MADDEMPKIRSRPVYASDDLGEKGTRTLPSEMICGVFEKLSTSGIHAKP
jgi:hypothetical protein